MTRPRGRSSSWIAMLGASAFALAALPADRFPPLWLVMFLAPGLLFERLSTPVFAARLGFAVRLGAAVLLQALVAFTLWRGDVAALDVVLTLQLLAPLAALIARGQQADQLLAVFLAFCVLMIATLLQHPAPLIELVAFAAFAIATFHLQTLPPATARTSVARRFVDASVVVVMSLTVVLCVLGALRALPSLERRDVAHPSAAGAGRGASSAGIGSDFLLDGSSRAFVDLSGPLVAEVTSRDGRAVDDDLYLRSGYFDIADIERWTSATPPRADARRVAGFDLQLRQPTPRVPERRFEFARMADLDRMLFLPTGATRLRGVPIVRANTAYGWYRDESERPARSYEVVYQELRPRVDFVVDDRYVPGLTMLPPALRDPRIVELVRTLLRDVRDRRPANVVPALMRGLAQRCRYDLAGPSGASGHALVDFLFGSRTGYCMHFASAMAVMLRLEGIPCRIAVGLHGGDAKGDDGRTRTYGGRHAHAWVEIPAAELGWATFDPTSLTDWANDPTTRTEPVAQPSDGDATAPTIDDRLHGLLPKVLDLAPWIALAMFAGLGLLAFAPWRRHATAAKRAETPEHRAVARDLDRLLRELARLGRPRPRHWTLEQFAVRLGTLPKDVRDAIVAAFVAYQDVRFGAQPLDAERTARLDAAIARVRAIATMDVTDEPATSA